MLRLRLAKTILRKIVPYRESIINRQNATIAILAARSGFTHVIEALAVKGANFNKKDDLGYTPLMMAIKNKKSFILPILLKYGANINLFDIGGHTPTWMAAASDNLDALILFSQNGADLNMPDNNGVTPLFIAAQEGNKAVVQFLLEHTRSETTPFTSNTVHLKNFSSKRNVSERMETVIQKKINQGWEEDLIPLIPEDIAYIMGYYDLAKYIQNLRHARVVQCQFRSKNKTLITINAHW